MPSTIQGTVPNIKFKKDYKILGRKSHDQIGLKSKIIFSFAILIFGLSSVIFANSYNDFVKDSNPNFAISNQILTSTISSNSSSVTTNLSNIQNLSSVSALPIPQSTIVDQTPSSPTAQTLVQNQNPEIQTTQSISSIRSEQLPKISLRALSGSDFQQIYESNQYFNVSDSINPTVTDVPSVDNYIKSLAEKRGFKLRPQAIEHYLVAIDGFLLQQPASDGWSKVKQAAANEGINLIMTSGYRSIASQKSIFAAGLASEYQVIDILSGKVDAALNKIMERAAVPGYSRHHTGYTIDIGCAGESTTFKNTSCYQWMKKDNFAQARLAGYIPSYPEGAISQGPNPEEWEFVWVGDTK